MISRSFQWRGASYRLDSSTWHFWSNARLLQRPDNSDELHLTVDEFGFIGFAVKAGYAYREDLDITAQLSACQAYLEQHGHRLWRVQDALQIVRDDADTDLSTRLLGCLITWFFLIKD